MRNDLDLGSRRRQDEVIRIHHAHVLAVLAREVEMSVQESLLLTQNFASALKTGAGGGVQRKRVLEAAAPAAVLSSRACNH